MQGDYGLFQCSDSCCRETFENEEMIRSMIKQQKDMKIPDSISIYLNVSNVIVASVIVLLIVDSNYRNYYYKHAIYGDCCTAS